MKRKILSILLMLPFAAFAQLTINQAPTGGPLPPATPTATQASLAWYRGGNLATPGFENIFGLFLFYIIEIDKIFSIPIQNVCI